MTEVQLISIVCSNVQDIVSLNNNKIGYTNQLSVNMAPELRVQILAHLKEPGGAEILTCLVTPAGRGATA